MFFQYRVKASAELYLQLYKAIIKERQYAIAKIEAFKLE